MSPRQEERALELAIAILILGLAVALAYLTAKERGIL